MAVTMNARWDDTGTVIPGGDAEYVVAEQPIAEYDNWFNYNIVADIQAVIDDVINKFNANTILKADSDNTPAALVVAEQTIVGRKTGNSIAALTDSEVLAIIGVAAGATKYPDTGEQAFLDADHSKLDGIELLADVTDATNVASSGAVMDSDFSPAEGFMRKTGAGAYTVIKSNLSAVVAPTVNEDSGDGYGIGSQWVDTTTDRVYVCLDVTVGAAVWSETSLSVHGAEHMGGGSDALDIYEISDDVFKSNDAEKETLLGTYTKLKEILLTKTAWNIRIYYGYTQRTTSTHLTYYRVYRNGVAVGTQKTLGSTTTWQSYSEDISGWVNGDLMQLYARTDTPEGTRGAKVKDFRILGKNPDIITTTNQDP